MTGHLLGAGGGIEAIACVKTLQEGVAHPTVGYQVADPDCDLDYITDGSRKVAAEYAISNSFGFGGHNGVICMKKWEEINNDKINECNRNYGNDSKPLPNLFYRLCG